jgi:uncharacterized protein GlcG (DUF336 family)
VRSARIIAADGAQRAIAAALAEARKQGWQVVIAVVDNSGDLDHLRAQVDDLWQQLQSLRDA